MNIIVVITINIVNALTIVINITIVIIINIVTTIIIVISITIVITINIVTTIIIVINITIVITINIVITIIIVINITIVITINIVITFIVVIVTIIVMITIIAITSIMLKPILVGVLDGFVDFSMVTNDRQGTFNLRHDHSSIGRRNLGEGVGIKYVGDGVYLVRTQTPGQAQQAGEALCGQVFTSSLMSTESSRT